MKVRMDFVTNSSSSSFTVAVKSKELTDKQKELIAEFVEKNLLGDFIDLSEDQSPDAIEDFLDESDVYLSEAEEEALKRAVNDGDAVRYGRVSYEAGDEYLLNDMLRRLLKTLDGVDGFNVISGDLSY